jgi:hypothetical protein
MFYLFSCPQPMHLHLGLLGSRQHRQQLQPLGRTSRHRKRSERSLFFYSFIGHCSSNPFISSLFLTTPDSQWPRPSPITTHSPNPSTVTSHTHARLHPARRLRSSRNPPDDARTPRRPLHVLSYFPNRDGSPLLRSPRSAQGEARRRNGRFGFVAAEGQSNDRDGGKDPGRTQGSSDAARRAQLDFYQRDGHDRLARLAERLVQTVVPSRPPRRRPLPKLPPRRTHHAKL